MLIYSIELVGHVKMMRLVTFPYRTVNFSLGAEMNNFLRAQIIPDERTISIPLDNEINAAREKSFQDIPRVRVDII